MKWFELKKKLKKAGFSYYRDAKGSHEIWSNDEGKHITVCNHDSKEVGTGLASKLLKEAGAK
ncbi:type II toxin-antitoxin system HicA family toxin [Pedobacter helvus]|uniref:Type II toxin-antitoxin system HicA family toxin n=1 Tax=Pedobacter helvus TaxID=2563444 RepID=A0ABW9JDY2_9SPHI|nr:type II toxin-antitoxin system HicA family toxin [Pedobacter ureilyticus]